MTAAALQPPVLPWSGLLPEDRRFWRILAVVMGVFLAICALLASVPLPPVEPEVANELPPRFARILAERVNVQRSNAVTNTKAPAPAGPSAKEGVPQAHTEPLVSRPSEPARPQPSSPIQQATAAGVLAMSEMLSELREMAPRSTLTGPTIRGVTIDAAVTETTSSALPPDVARGSGGIARDIVSNRDVLGSGTLRSEDVVTAYGPVASEQADPLPGSVSSGAVRKRGRSQEEIQALLDRSKSRMYRAYNQALSDVPTLRGKVVVRFTIAPAGQVTQCRIVFSDLNNPALEAELVRIIRRINFGAKPKVPAVTTKVPIEFFPT